MEGERHGMCELTLNDPVYFSKPDGENFQFWTTTES
jgi:hypothetical protein